jgi:hypothetical protein
MEYGNSGVTIDAGISEKLNEYELLKKVGCMEFVNSNK